MKIMQYPLVSISNIKLSKTIFRAQKFYFNLGKVKKDIVLP